MQNFGFLFPWFLLSFLGLPILWRFLRHNPPKPKKEKFTYFYLLKFIKKNDKLVEKPFIPLLLLRLFLVSLIIFSFSHPLQKPKALVLKSDNDLLFLIDNSWCEQAHWKEKIEEAYAFFNNLPKDKKIYFIPTIEDKKIIEKNLKEPDSIKSVKNKISSLEVQPLTVNRLEIFQKIAQNFKDHQGSIDIIYFTDGLKYQNDKKAFEILKKLNPKKFIIQQFSGKELYALTNLTQENQSFKVTIKRYLKNLNSLKDTNLSLSALDLQGRVIAKTTAQFIRKEKETHAIFSIPLEIRNKVVAIKIDNQMNAGSIFLLGSQYKRNHIVLFSLPLHEIPNPLLSPFYYLAKALEENNDLTYLKNASFSENISDILLQNPDIIFLDDRILADNENSRKLKNFVENGGTLVRFAGPKLAKSPEKDILLPIKLRNRTRVLDSNFRMGNALSIERFSSKSPFKEMEIPKDLKIYRQILPQISSEMQERIWIFLDDGTPFLSAKKEKNGWFFFVHTSLNEKWSNLALNNFFIPFLKQLTNLTVSQSSLPSFKKGTSQNTKKEKISLYPWRIINKYGDLTSANDTLPISDIDFDKKDPSFHHEAGLYKYKNDLYPFNLFKEKQNLESIIIPEYFNAEIITNEGKSAKDFLPFLAFLVMIFFLIDYFYNLKKEFFLRGKITPLFSKFIFLFLSFYIYNQASPMILDAKALDMVEERNIEAARKTHLAYIITGDEELDETSKLGLESLTEFIIQKTTISPGKVHGLDLEKDDLSFYPLIYWPINAHQKILSKEVIEKINFYMQYGGTILFDTGDQFEKSNFLSQDKTTNASQNLQKILSQLNVPPLGKVTKDNVLSRSFYLMPNFPGLYSASPLWCVSDKDPEQKEFLEQRDEVSPLLITANNLAAAWAKLQNGEYKYPLIEDQPRQRLWAFRGGINLILYVLTGSYKSDQYHVKSLLDRQSYR